MVWCSTGVVLEWCSCGGVFLVVWCSTGVVLEWCFSGGVVVWRCFCVVFLWWGGGVFVVVFLWVCFCGGVFVVVWWCFCGGVFVVVFLWWCSCGGVMVFLCFCGGVFVFLWWCFCMFFLVKGRLSSHYREVMQRVLATMGYFGTQSLIPFGFNIAEPHLVARPLKERGEKKKRREKR